MDIKSEINLRAEAIEEILKKAEEKKSKNTEAKRSRYFQELKLADKIYLLVLLQMFIFSASLIS